MSSPSASCGRARVCAAAQEHYFIRFENGDESSAVPAGTLRWSGDLPAVGDWVVARRADPSLALIERVEPRTTVISRQRPGGGEEQVLAANVGMIGIVMALDGDYNPRRLERYLVLAAASGAEAMVVLNKKDVCPDWKWRLAEIREIEPNTICLAARESVDPLRVAVGGRTAVLLGSSGAGKSTIANGLMGDFRQSTQPVREYDCRGRHTTTQRMLFDLPGGGSLIDTPGLRELAPWAGPEAVDDVFSEIVRLAARCRFHDCAHAGEPGCAVVRALESGELEAARWASYQKLLAEARHHERSSEARAAAEEKRKWKVIHKALRHHPKFNR
jgi:ribosome biogenesis GTPase